MEPITAAEYFTECQAIARELVQECEGDEEQIQNRLHETIDGHQWIIYTYYNLQVLAHSKNENAYFDAFGKLETEDFSSTMARLAFCALEADVHEEIPEALSAYQAEKAS